MSSREKQEERNFLMECIKLYKRLPVLWNLKHKEYHNRNKKSYQYEVLLRKYRERYRGATKEDLLKKINSLRTNFRKELKRINEAHQKGDVNVEPTLWYYEEMQFLTNQENNTEEKEVEEEIFMPIKVHPPKKAQNKLGEIQELKTDSPLRPKPRKLLPKDNILINRNDQVFAPNAFLLSTTRHISPIQNEYEKIAAFWAVELQKMDTRQQLFAKKAINDVLFEGQLGNLHKNSVEINRIDHGDSTFESYSQNSYEPSIYKDDSKHTKFKIQQVDPIEHDTLLNTITPEINIQEEEEMEIEDTETLNDDYEDIQQLLENPIYTEEEKHDTTDKNQSDEETLECQIYTFSDRQKAHRNDKKQPNAKRVV